MDEGRGIYSVAMFQPKLTGCQKAGLSIFYIPEVKPYV